MNLLNTVKRMFIGDPGEPYMLDHIPVKDVPDWREKKLGEAAVKLGHPFKCGPDGLPRETMKDKNKAFVVAKPQEPKASVTPIKAKVRK